MGADTLCRYEPFVFQTLVRIRLNEELTCLPKYFYLARFISTDNPDFTTPLILITMSDPYISKFCPILKIQQNSAASAPDSADNLLTETNQLGSRSFDRRNTRTHSDARPSVQERKPVTDNDLIGVALSERSCTSISSLDQISHLTTRESPPVSSANETSLGNCCFSCLFRWKNRKASSPPASATNMPVFSTKISATIPFFRETSLTTREFTTLPFFNGAFEYSDSYLNSAFEHSPPPSFFGTSDSVIECSSHDSGSRPYFGTITERGELPPFERVFLSETLNPPIFVKEAPQSITRESATAPLLDVDEISLLTISETSPTLTLSEISDTTTGYSDPNPDRTFEYSSSYLNRAFEYSDASSAESNLSPSFGGTSVSVIGCGLHGSGSHPYFGTMTERPTTPPISEMSLLEIPEHPPSPSLGEVPEHPPSPSLGEEPEHPPSPPFSETSSIVTEYNLPVPSLALDEISDLIIGWDSIASHLYSGKFGTMAEPGALPPLRTMSLLETLEPPPHCIYTFTGRETSVFTPRRSTIIEEIEEIEKTPDEIILEIITPVKHGIKKEQMVLIEAQKNSPFREYYGLHKVINTIHEGNKLTVSVDRKLTWDPKKQSLFPATDVPRVTEIELPKDQPDKQKILLDRLGLV